ncbi:MAG: hypothetical protein MPJ50_07745 [Pirellulales bacterium]|nr:hypothetical protein [Pirellulales bacterium]
MTQFKSPWRRFQFSIGQLLILVLVVSLLIAHFLMWQRLAKIENRITDSATGFIPPVSLHDVKIQFESQTSDSGLKITVDDVRYSESKDAYRVDYTSLDTVSGRKGVSHIELQGDDYQLYHGRFQNPHYPSNMAYQSRQVIIK